MFGSHRQRLNKRKYLDYSIWSFGLHTSGSDDVGGANRHGLLLVLCFVSGGAHKLVGALLTRKVALLE